MFKSSLSQSLFEQFSENYQKVQQAHHSIQKPYVFVDQSGSIKLLTNIMDGDLDDSGVFAMSVAGDGLVEYLSIS